MPDASAEITLSLRQLPCEDMESFFAAGGITIYCTTPSPWRWRVCAKHKSLQAVVIDPEMLLEKNALPQLPVKQHQIKELSTVKPFEQSTLVQWLTRATSKNAGDANLYASLAEKEDVEAFLRLTHFARDEWDMMAALPSLTAAEIRHFKQSHNAALSDIENAFLPGRIDLPEPLASFYIRHLVEARRDTEATLIIAQATHSTRLPRLISDALAVGAFEGAGNTPLHYAGNDYAQSAVQDTSACTDAAMALAARKLALPIDHEGHLLRMSMMELTRTAAEIVEENRPAPFAFLLKARELFTSRCDVCRFPPLQRFATAVAENDLNGDESWVQRLVLAHERLFEGRATSPGGSNTQNDGKILAFSRR